MSSPASEPGRSTPGGGWARRRPVAPTDSLGSAETWGLLGRRLDAADGLGIYIVLLLVVPSNLTIAGAASYGRPSFIWGLALLLWWLIWRLQARESTPTWRSQPVRFVFGAFVVVVLISFAAALLRGQPPDQISPAVSAIARVASWAGVLLVALDGLQSRAQFIRLTRLLVLIASLLAVLGLAQSFTGQSFLSWVATLPGVEFNADDTVSARGTFSRAAGTAIHPLEHVTMLIGILPLAIVCGSTRGFSGKASRVGPLWLTPSLLITLSCLVSVSRSAIVGLAVAVAASFPALPRRYRWALAVGGLFAAGVVTVAVPGMFSTVVSLFSNATSDPSTQSRASALARLPEFMASSPLLGAGLGTFLPRYYIFDNQWVMLLVEVGILGTLAFAAMVVAATWSALDAGRRFGSGQDAMLSRAVAASAISLAAAYAFFDALAFPMSAGLMFLMSGIGGALRNLSTRADPALRSRLEHPAAPFPVPRV